jgi:uncharacterized membrane protein (UPF0182 family)
VAQGPGNKPRPAAAGSTDSSTSSSKDVLSTESGTARFVPYYTMFKGPGDPAPSFELLRPFVPFSTDDSRKELQAYMVASSDPATYGQLRAYVLATTADGPATVAATMESDTAISQQLTLLDQGGSSVIYGDLQLVPVAGGLLYLRPLYVQSDAASQPSFRYMLASYNGKAAFGDSLETVIGKLFPGFRADIGDVTGTDTSTTAPTGSTTPGQTTVPPPTPTTDTPQVLLSKADKLFAEADAALATTPPDFATYSAKNAQARALVQQALKQLGG